MINAAAKWVHTVQVHTVQCSFSDEKEVVLLSKTQGYKHPSPIKAQLRVVTGKQEFLWRRLWHCQSCRNFLSVTGKGKEAPRVGASFPVTPLHSSVFLPYLSIFLFLCMCVYVCVWCMHTCAFMQIYVSHVTDKYDMCRPEEDSDVTLYRISWR